MQYLAKNIRGHPSSTYAYASSFLDPLVHKFLQPPLLNVLTTTAVSSEAWAKLRDWASVAGRGRLLLSGSIAHASLKTAVVYDNCNICQTEQLILPELGIAVVKIVD